MKNPIQRLKGLFMSAEKSQNTIYFNGNILTMSDKEATVEALVTDTNKIVATGRYSDIIAQYPTANKVNLNGKTLLPGFIENHTHLDAVANCLQLEDLSAMKYTDDNEMMEAFRNITPDQNGWLWAIGWDKKRQKLPTLEEMDEVFPNNPFWCVMAGHGGWFNSKCLEVMGVTKDNHPEGFNFELTDDGRYTGFVAGNAATLKAWIKAPVPTVEDLVVASKEYAKQGFTTASEHLIFAPHTLETLVEASKLDEFSVRCVGGIVNAYPDFAPVIVGRDNYKTDKFEIRYLKAFTDGAVQAGNAATDLEYQNPEYKDTPRPVWGTPEQFNQTAAAALEMGVDFLFHANGERGLNIALDAVEFARNVAKEKGIDDSNFKALAHHLSLTNENQYARMASLGVSPSFIMGHHYWTGDNIINDYFKQEDHDHAFKVKTAIEYGLKPTLHNDAPVSPTHAWRSIQSAVTRKTRFGNELNVNDAITVEQALRGYTIWAAEQFGIDKEVGSLEVGKYADLVIVDSDPLTKDSEQLENIGVVKTVFRGNVTYAA